MHAPDSELALHVENVSKTYGRSHALDDLTLEVPRGELFALVGGNGAGKTTLIKCALDFCSPDAGEIRIFGVSSRVTAARNNIAFLPERFSPPYYLTGRDFLRYMFSLHRRTYDEEHIVRMFERLDLDASALKRPARTYSKGMTQKLGLVACLASGKIFQILDEPMSGLDPKARALLKRELRTMRHNGHTVFLTSHSLADVEELCERMAVLHSGRLRFAGTPRQLVAAYGTTDLEQAFLASISD